MAQRINRLIHSRGLTKLPFFGWRFFVSLPDIFPRSLAVLISMILLSESVAATPRRMGVTIAQQPATTEQDATRAAADQAYQEGLQLYKQGTAESLKQAIEKWEEALPLFRGVGNKAGEAVTLYNIGSVYSALGEKQQALDYYNRSLPLSQAVGDKAQEASTLNNIGSVYSDLGELQQALDYYRRSLPLFRAVGNKAGEATTLTNIGSVYSDLGELQQALDYYRRSLPLFRAVGNKAGEATTLNNIGSVYDALGEKQQALDYYRRSLPLSRAVRDKVGEATTLTNIGLVYSDLGEKQQALDYYNRSLPLFRAVGNKAGEATTLNNIGSVYDALGEKQQALDYYRRSLPLKRAVGDKAGEATTLTNIGLVYSDLGELQQALDYYNRSLPLSQAVGDKAGEAVTLSGIGLVYSSLGELQQALDYYNRSLPLSQAVGDKVGEATTLNNIGLVYSSLGEKQQALNYLNQSLPLSQAVGDRAGEAVTLNNIGGVYSDLGEKQQALDYFNRSLPLSQAVGGKAEEATTLSNIALLESDRGNLKEAVTQMEASIKIIESLRTKVVNTELRASYFATVQDYYKFYIDLLMQLHKTSPSSGYNAKALQASESSRARVLIELLTEAGVDIRKGVDPNLLQQERTITQQINALENRRLLSGQYTNKQKAEIEQKIASLLDQSQEVVAQIKVKSPAYKDLKYPEPLTLPEIQQQVLDDNTLLLEYSLAKDRSYLWAVTKTGITSYELPKNADIEAAAKDFDKLLKSANANPEQLTAAGTKLSQMLLAPVASQLGNKRLLIVGDGILQSVPFSALPTLTSTQKQYTPLLVEHEIVNMPSATALATLRNEAKNRPLAAKAIAVLADPVFTSNDPRIKKTTRGTANQQSIPIELERSALDSGVTLSRLPHSRTEADNILALVPDSEEKSAFGFAASLTAATNPDLAQYQMIHFATHGLLNSEHPELSGVALSLVDEKGAPIDGFLRLNDIFNLNLPAELVVLSACQTGLGKDVQGEGLVGLTRGFMYAGAKRVVVSLWSVSDLSTSELMQKFYTNMLTGKLTPVAAMRAAQLDMWKQEKSPYHWAAFVTQGEWN